MQPQDRLIRILVVEDDPEDFLLLSEDLKSDPLAYIETIYIDDLELKRFVTKSGRFTGYSAPLPDVILLCPFTNRFDIPYTIVLLRACGYEKVPIVGMLIAEFERDYLQGKNLDLTGYVIKPVTLEQLQQCIDQSECLSF